MIQRRTLFFEPLDVLLFRDHRPFDQGLNVVARSRFPLPSVFIGCMRYGPLIARIVGDKTDSSDRTLEPLLPLPRDLIQQSECGEREPSKDRNLRCEVLEIKFLDHLKHPPRRLHWSKGTLNEVKNGLPWSTNRGSSPPDMLITLAGARRYLNETPGQIFELQKQQSTSGAEVVRFSAVCQVEVRVGIAREPSEPTLVVQQGMFYVTRTFRLAPKHGFAVEVRYPDEPEISALIQKLDGRIVPLGGKGHRARIQLVNQSLLPDDLVPPWQRNRNGTPCVQPDGRNAFIGCRNPRWQRKQGHLGQQTAPRRLRLQCQASIRDRRPGKVA